MNEVRWKTKKFSFYQAFYGSFLWRNRIPIIWHIGWIALKCMQWRNRRILTLTMEEFRAEHGDEVSNKIKSMIDERMSGVTIRRPANKIEVIANMKVRKQIQDMDITNIKNKVKG